MLGGWLSFSFLQRISSRRQTNMPPVPAALTRLGLASTDRASERATNQPPTGAAGAVARSACRNHSLSGRLRDEVRVLFYILYGVRWWSFCFHSACRPLQRTTQSVKHLLACIAPPLPRSVHLRYTECLPCAANALSRKADNNRQLINAAKLESNSCGAVIRATCTSCTSTTASFGSVSAIDFDGRAEQSRAEPRVGRLHTLGIFHNVLAIFLRSDYDYSSISHISSHDFGDSFQLNEIYELIPF